MNLINYKNNASGLNNSFKYKYLATCMLGLFTSLQANANTTIWQENFDAAALNGKGAVYNNVDMDGVTNWSIDVSGASLTASSDWFKVNNGLFEGRDLDGVAIWQSESIDISGHSGVKLSINASENGTHEAQDFIDLEYSVDGGAFVKVTNWQSQGSDSHTLIDDFTSATVEADIPTGSSLFVRVSMMNNAGSEYIRFDDVIVTATGGGDTGGGDTGGGDTISDACFNCPDLSKIKDATSFSDSSYYADVISAVDSAQSSAVIKEKITQAISAEHNKLSYSEVWTALTKTDEDPANNNNVILLYKGNSIAKFSNGSGTQSGDPDNWNREHVWAKSHGFPSSSTYAYTDIHHLRPSDISVNSSRGNLDFDFSDQPLAEAPANRVDGDSFEPSDAVKGDVARMIFYMDTRYEGLDGGTPDLQVVDHITSTGEAKLGKLCSLLAWHEADPVDEFEQNRNNRAYEFQGNRNPFIDHPEWIDLVYQADCSGGGDTGGGDTGGGDTGGGDTGGGDTGGGDTGGDTGGGTENGALIISEYVEGSSYNKAVEITNTSNAVIDLTGYQVKLFSNGNTSETSVQALSGSLAAGASLVVGHSSAAEPLKSMINVFSSVANFNGNDYVELAYNDTVIDGVGIFGSDVSWGSNKTLVRKSSVVTGDSNRTDTFVIEDQWTAYPSNTFDYLGAHVVDAGDGVTVQIGQCSDEATLISSVQGIDDASPMVDATVVIEGVVTSIEPSLQGYFVQEELADSDSNEASSEGIFVYHSGISQYPSVGNTVRVLGEVREFYNRTQLATSQTYADCGVLGSVAIATLSLPAENASAFESLEGMLVNVEQTLTVTDNYDLAKYGQFAVSNGRLVKPTNLYPAGSAQAVALQARNDLNRLLIDDKNNTKNPEVVPFPDGDLSHNNTLRLGDSVSNIAGVLDYSYGEYRVLPSHALQFTRSNDRSGVPTMNEGSLKVASFNVLNYFNGPDFPTARGASSAEEFERQSNKIVSAISAINADIVGLMEVENDGYGAQSAVAELVNRLNAVMGADTYRYVSYSVDELGGDKIASGLIYKPSKVNLVGDAVSILGVPFDYGNRPPMVQTFSEIASGEELTIAVNHFRSKGSCSSATGGNQDSGDGQGCWNQVRVDAANALMSWLATKPTGTSDDDVLIIGDLNSYGSEDPIITLVNGGFQDLIKRFTGSTGYSYAYGGEIGYIDHALASESLAGQVVDTAIWHINTDEPKAFDYNLEYKSVANQANFYGPDAYRASDHDPIIINLQLASSTSLAGDLDGDGDIDMNDVRAFSNGLRSGESYDMSFDFNKDGIVSTADVRAMMALCTRSRCTV